VALQNFQVTGLAIPALQFLLRESKIITRADDDDLRIKVLQLNYRDLPMEASTLMEIVIRCDYKYSPLYERAVAQLSTRLLDFKSIALEVAGFLLLLRTDNKFKTLGEPEKNKIDQHVILPMRTTLERRLDFNQPQLIETISQLFAQARIDPKQVVSLMTTIQ
jgi:hypothetical protein